MIYVDSLFSCKKNKNWPYDKACHLLADTEKELVEFALKIGLKKSWIQFPETWKAHFDLTPNKRKEAVKQGAKEMTREEKAAFYILKGQGNEFFKAHS